ncbi:MAG: bifunctional 4-hydroxy-3-methylbut-2-enyl diphosphate reductase/30S ribosomal protein S1 [Bacillota bacterium]
MQVIVAKNSGFCFGVKRALSLAKEQAALETPVYTSGELIHNQAVVDELCAQGIVPVNDLSMLKEGDILIIRAHGLPKEQIEGCAARGVRVVDATCPYVKKIHRTVEQAKKDGKQVVIVGKPGHPEVIGIDGWCGNTAIIVDSVKDVDAIPANMNVCVVAQTTYPPEEYELILRQIREKSAAVEAHHTICDTTLSRREEAIRLSERSDAVIVVGGRNSANTQKLYDLCKKRCDNTHTIEKPNELSLEIIDSNDIIGIVAGASTPDWMIREVTTRMSELEKTMAESPQVENQEIEKEAEAAVEQSAAATSAAKETESPEAGESSFAEAFEKTLVRIRNGQIITGSVVQIVDGEVCVNIGYKSDGFIPKNEFSSDPDVSPADVVKIGDEIEVEVLKVNDGEGNVILSHKSVESKKVWDVFMQDEDLETKVFEGVGKEVVKGGLIAMINGVRAFVPASHVSTKYVENLNDFIGKPLKLKVIEVDKPRKRIVASQKEVLVAEAAAEKKKTWEKLVVGSKVQGVVRRLTDFGAFVDIGGVDGLVHVTDIGWGRVKHPSDVLKIGQSIEVLILNVDVAKERVSLGYKQLQPKPWTMAAEKYPVGSIVEGKVVRIVPFGAFVALEPTIDGLIHISQVAVRRIAKVEDEINVGDVVRCKVLDVNMEAKRISLSRKEVILEENPEILEQIEQEKLEREKANAERQAQRQATSEQHSQKQQEPRSPRPERTERSERSDRRSRNEDGDYQLPPVQQATTSLADLFSNFNAENEDQE